MDKTKERERSMVPLPTELYVRLKKQAVQNNRPVSWEIRELLEWALRQARTGQKD